MVKQFTHKLCHVQLGHLFKQYTTRQLINLVMFQKIFVFQEHMPFHFYAEVLLYNVIPSIHLNSLQALFYCSSKTHQLQRILNIVWKWMSMCLFSVFLKPNSLVSISWVWGASPSSTKLCFFRRILLWISCMNNSDYFLTSLMDAKGFSRKSICNLLSSEVFF